MSSRRSETGAGRRSGKWRWWLLALVIGGVPLTSSLLRLSLPEPSGPHGVGRDRMVLADTSRSELLDDDPSAVREVIVEVWYPAQPNTGQPASYLDLAQLSSGLIESGEVESMETWGLRFVGGNGRMNAAVPTGSDLFPVVMISPGNATNVEFYSTFAEGLASHGYLVLGINHPYDVAAVALGDGAVAVYPAQVVPEPIQQHQASIATRITERVADLRFVLDRLAGIDSADHEWVVRVDYSRIGAMGHSLGGVTAAETCAGDSRLMACLNLDGLMEGGPFSRSIEGAVLNQPFMFITKEAALHPAIEERFDQVSGGSHWVVVPEAAHTDFVDSSLFQPTLIPATPPAAGTLRASLAITTAFFDETLRLIPAEYDRLADQHGLIINTYLR